MPLTVQGSSLCGPRAIPIIGGLLSSLLLSSLVSPVLYKLLPPGVDHAAAAQPSPAQDVEPGVSYAGSL